MPEGRRPGLGKDSRAAVKNLDLMIATGDRCTDAGNEHHIGHEPADCEDGLAGSGIKLLTVRLMGPDDKALTANGSVQDIWLVQRLRRRQPGRAIDRKTERGQQPDNG